LEYLGRYPHDETELDICIIAGDLPAAKSRQVNARQHRRTYITCVGIGRFGTHEGRSRSVQPFRGEGEGRFRFLRPNVSLAPPEHFLGITLRVKRQACPDAILTYGRPEGIGAIPEFTFETQGVIR